MEEVKKNIGEKKKNQGDGGKVRRREERTVSIYIYV